VTCRGVVPREFRSLPLGRKPTFVALDVQRLGCECCQVVRQDALDFAAPKKRYTRAFGRYALELSRAMTIKDVARHLDVSWDVIKGIQKDHLQRRYGKPRLKHLKFLAIDEISTGKGHRYLTVVLDWRSGAIVFVGDGKGADALEPFWKRLRASHARVEAVAIDMSAAYINALQEHLPNATIVFDHFHVIKLFNDKLSDLRRDVQRDAETVQQKKVLKGTRWLLLKNPDNLNDQKNERQRLEEALELNRPLATAYYMKEDLRTLWDQPDKATATTKLDDWIRRAQITGIPMLQRFANTLGAHRTGILAYHDFPLSTGPLEGTNNKIKTMKRQAYGFRDHEFLKLKIYGIHETKYALVG
jgi:transposase